MQFFWRFVITFFLAVVLSYLATHLFRRLALKANWVDSPTDKKIHTKPIATMGGICLFIVYWAVYFFGIPINNQIVGVAPLVISSFVILVVGIIDDKVELKPWQKLIGILIGANIYYFFTDIRLDHFTVAFLGRIEFYEISYIIMMLWIVGITNAMNLMDGLDGLATGTAIISLTTMGLVSYLFTNSGNNALVVLTFLLVAVLLGFLPHNFQPAKIFLGDTGALFIGFMIATLSLNGLKQATFVSLIIPIAILGVPLTDTVSAIFRRLLNKKSISRKDWGHLHHRLLRLGFTHRQAVLFIYAMGIIFSLIALLFPISSLLGTIFLLVCLLLGIILFVESFNLLDSQRTPLRRLLRYLQRKRKTRKR